MKSKRCGHCHRDRPVEEFHRDYSKPDHLGSLCVWCKRELRLTAQNGPDRQSAVGDGPQPKRRTGR